MPKAALAWVLANPVVTSVILGASRPEQLDDTLSALDVTLDPALKLKLDELSHEYRYGDALR
jgi:aryl-alcohol dehydrogenase-like predicted oxidoreductase